MTFAAAKFRKFLPAAMFAMLVEFLMGLSSSVICGNLIGENGLSVVNLMQPAMGIVSFFALLTGTGTSVLYATEMGKFDRRRASELLTQGAWNVAVFGLLMMAGLAATRTAVCEAFGVSGAVLAGVKEFWLWFLPCAVLEPAMFFTASMCYADGDDKVCACAYLVQLAGCVAFTVPLTAAMGFAGCALGMGLCHLAALAVLAWHWRRKGNSLKFVRHFSFGDMMRICRCSAGDASVKVCQAVLFLVMNLYVVSRFGEGKLPVLAVVTAIIAMSEVFDGIATAAQPLASVYIGERNDRLTRRIMRYAARASVWSSVSIMVVLMAFPQLVTWMVGIRDAELAAAARTAVRLTCLGVPGTALVMLMNSYYTFRAHEGLATTVTVLASVAIPLALLPVAGRLPGMGGIWLALAAGPYLALAAIAWWVTERYGRQNWPLFLSRARERKIRVFDLELTERAICDTAEKIGKFLRIRQGMNERRAGLTSLLVEETLMTVKERNRGKRIRSEITVDRNDAKELGVTIRDDGEIFDITDTDTEVDSLRTYLVANIMTALPARRNMTTTGFNRNSFKI